MGCNPLASTQRSGLLGRLLSPLETNIGGSHMAYSAEMAAMIDFAIFISFGLGAAFSFGLCTWLHRHERRRYRSAIRHMHHMQGVIERMQQMRVKPTIIAGGRK